MDYAGPLWIGSIVDEAFLKQVIEENQKTAFRNSAKITKLLSTAKNEATAPATYYVLDKLSGKLNLPSPSVQSFLSTLQNNGFLAVATHFNSRGIKTDAPALTMQKTLQKLVSENANPT
jgi:tRNA (guanine26-N2/guanine27-N2)-dimethyltransferase